MNKMYPEYKNSDLEWLDRVPSHWELSKMRHVAEINNSNVNKKSYDDEQQVRLCNYTDVYYNEYITNDMDLMLSTASESEIDRHTLREGDVIITKDSEDRDDIAVPACVGEELENVVCGYHLTVLRGFPSELDGRYLLRALQANGIREQFYVAANGITRFGLSLRHIKNALIPVPPLEEQRILADYLDRKTEQIDTLIARKQRLIELLQEQRTAIINRAVTKGLDSDAPMKDSGIEWLGEVPAHWEVCQIKRLLSESEYGVSESLSGDGHIRVLTMAHIQDGEIKPPEEGCLEEVSKEMLLQRDDLLFNRTNSLAHVGKVGIFRGSKDDKVSFASYLVRMRPNDKALPHYLHYLFNSFWMLSTARSVAIPSINQANLNPTRYGEIRTCIPPIEEQEEIILFLDQRTHEIERIICREAEIIGRLQELRTSLISEVVTGKIDVREETAVEAPSLETEAVAA